MKNLLTNEQMRKVDAFAMQKVSSLELMEHAGKAVFKRIQELLKDRSGKVVCVCGGGNNGGDGFVTARLLLSNRYDVCVLCRAEKFSKEAIVNRGKYLSLGGEIFSDMPKDRVTIIVDCLLGTGFFGEVRAETSALIKLINAKKEAGSYVVSVDIPSGICGDNGLGELFVFADETLCVGEEKLGVWLLNGLDGAGEVRTLDIGLKGFENENYVRLIEKQDVKKLLPVRRRNSHKGSYGKVAILGGSEQYFGAGYLSCLSALNSGVGYTAWFLPKELIKTAFLKIPEALFVSTNDGYRYEFSEEICQKLCEYDAIALGMGLGVSEAIYKTILYLFKHYNGKLLLDADGLNSLAKFGKADDFLKIKECDVVITPHMKEFSRLTKIDISDLQSEPLRYINEWMKKYATTLLLKGASTLIASGQKIVLTARGCSAQAKGGSGDVLAGLIAGLCAQGKNSFEAAVLGSYMVGVSAEICAKNKSEYSALPTDFIACIGAAFCSISDTRKFE
ncbi:MAG: NAD(P)H-hydrate dehydratase [Clostridia bacterium]|nr:NAD(P)H-hydrate dehydratase [Clostridia bacterium]